jgi:hypothetical protein
LQRLLYDAQSDVRQGRQRAANKRHFAEASRLTTIGQYALIPSEKIWAGAASYHPHKFKEHAMSVAGFNHYNLRAARPVLDTLRDFYVNVVGLLTLPSKNVSVTESM